MTQTEKEQIAAEALAVITARFGNANAAEIEDILERARMQAITGEVGTTES